MSDEASVALEASIISWKKKAKARHPKSVDLGPDTCALCALYIANDGRGDFCVGCPVRVAGFKGCSNRQYREVVDAHKEWSHAYIRGDSWVEKKAARSRFIECAMAEIAFLEGLRPKEGEA